MVLRKIIPIFVILLIALAWLGKSTKDYEFTLSGGEFDLDVKVLITSDLDYAVKYVQKNLDMP